MITFPREVVQRSLLNFTKRMPKGLGLFVWPFVRGMGLGLLVLLVGGYGAFRIAYQQRVLPGVRVAGVEVAGLSASDAIYLLETKFDDYLNNHQLITLAHEMNSWQIPLVSLSLEVDREQLRAQVLEAGRDNNIFNNLKNQWELLFGLGADLPLALNYDHKGLTDLVATASAQINNPVIPPRVFVGEQYNPQTNSLIVVEPGMPGRVVDREQTAGAIVTALSTLKTPTVELITDYVSVSVSEEQLKTAEEKAKTILTGEILIYFEDESTGERREWKLTGADLVSFLAVTSEYDLAALANYVELLANSINRPAQNALFQFDEAANKVVSFMPAKRGLSVQSDRLSMSIRQEMDKILTSQLADDILVAVYQTDPQVDTGSVNDLGIETLLGRGESTYYHSSISRQHNVELAAKKLNGVLVPPGEAFSFNKAVGEVTKATGFLQAFVIRDGQTILGDGGGVCQDSTTIFRAVLDAGLPIGAWQNHSYRVGYYEQNSKPGFDATVYSPSPDFKFTNDTEAYILIQTKAEGMKLTYELYGTDDGREATISNYAQWGASPPPPDLHKDDPSLPVGTVKKVESAVAGLKTKFDYVVTRGGETIFQKTFVSNYRPWQAVYLHGTGQ